MIVMLTGGSGLLGKALIEESPRDVQVISLVRTINTDLPFDNVTQVVVDLSEEQNLEGLLLRYKPDVFIHAAAEGRVDIVQENHSLGHLVNVEYTKNIAKVCAKYSVHLIFISTNAVFGDQQIPFCESDPPKPLNKYGELKLEAELAIEQICDSYLILRPILMYGWPYQVGRTNPACAWVHSMRNNMTISVVNDVYSQPLSVYDCGRLIWMVCESKIQGILHVSGKEHVTLYQFALEVAFSFDLDQGLVIPAKSSDFPSLAPRPTNTKYSQTRLTSEVGFTPKSLREGLLEMRMRESLD